MKENKVPLFVFFMFFLSLLVFSFAIYLGKSIVLEEKEIFTSLRLGGTPGFDINNTALNFGTIAIYTSSQRNLTIENNYGFPIKVEFSVKGNITEFLLFDEVAYLDVGESRDVLVETITLSDNRIGSYSGKFIIVIKKSWKDI